MSDTDNTLEVNYDDFEGDDVEGDDEMFEEDRKNTVKQKKAGKKMATPEREAYLEQIGGTLDSDDDMGWAVDTKDVDEVDMEGSSTSFKKNNVFSKIKEDKRDGEHRLLIESLKLQFRYFNKELDSLVSSMKERIKRLEKNKIFVTPSAKILIESTKKDLERLENKQRYRLFINSPCLFRTCVERSFLILERNANLAKFSLANE